MGVFLIVMMLYTLYQLLNQPGRVVVQPDGVRGLRGRSTSWRVDTDAIDSIYVSEVVNRKGKKRVIYHGELNLLLKNGRFQPVLLQPQAVEDDNAPNPEDAEENIISLSLYNAKSDLQMAGLYVAQTLNLECRYDRRVK